MYQVLAILVSVDYFGFLTICNASVILNEKRSRKFYVVLHYPLPIALPSTLLLFTKKRMKVFVFYTKAKKEGIQTGLKVSNKRTLVVMNYLI